MPSGRGQWARVRAAGGVLDSFVAFLKEPSAILDGPRSVSYRSPEARNPA
jgi:hypothetical protein